MEAPGSRTVLPEVRYHPSITGEARGTTAPGTRAPRTRNRRARSQNPDAAQQHTGSGPVQAGPESLRPPVPPAPGEKLSVSLVRQVEVLTRGQRENPDWFAWRHHRITASVAHRIAHSRFANGKSQTPPASYLAAITGEGSNVQTRAMKWGVSKEAVAVRSYETIKSRQRGRDVRVQECGLFIDAQRPWLAASPDGIVTDRQSGQQLLLLEVKCPYKHRERTVAQACQEDPAFCLELLDHAPGQYRVKQGHSYHTQVQVQMAVSGVHQADLVLFTLRETAIVPLTFDPAFWADTLAKLEVFYRNAVVPHARHAPAARPEL